MHDTKLDIAILGSSITSSSGNGHAAIYRPLVRGLHERGHDVVFLQRDASPDSPNRETLSSPWASLRLYGSLAQLRDTHRAAVADADLVIVGSGLPQGAEAVQWVQDTARGIVAFYDIDAPDTAAQLQDRDCDYLRADQAPRFDLYLSAVGGPTLRQIERRLGSPRALPLYSSVDQELYSPQHVDLCWDMGYMGPYRDDRQPILNELLLQPATRWKNGKFVVAGGQYPQSIRWGANVHRIEDLAEDEQASFYSCQRFALSVACSSVACVGWSLNPELLQAAACGTAVISDWWDGLDTFFQIGSEVLVAGSSEEVLTFLRSVPESRRHELGQQARARVLAEHTGLHRAIQLEEYALAALAQRRSLRRKAG